MPFHWSEIHQKAFTEVKEMLVKPPILHLPRPTGRFILYCDTSKDPHRQFSLASTGW